MNSLKRLESTPFDKLPCHVAFVLLPDFSAFSLAAIADVLSAANGLLGRQQFQYSVLRLTDSASGSLRVLDQDCAATDFRTKWVILVGGDRRELGNGSLLRVLTLRTLRRADFICATGSGVSLLASCGLLAGRRVAIRPDYRRSFQERLPEIEFVDERIATDGNIWTTPGGAAAIDMGFEIVRFSTGIAIPNELAPRLGVEDCSGTSGRRLSVSARYGVRHEKLAKAIQYIENLEECALVAHELAAHVRLSTRQVERLFRAHLNCSPVQFDFGARLRRSKELLGQTAMSVVDVAHSCGFVNSAHFSRRFKREFGESPTEHRNKSGIEGGVERAA